jgi:hypothetical protein
MMNHHQDKMDDMSLNHQIALAAAATAAVTAAANGPSKKIFIIFKFIMNLQL